MTRLRIRHSTLKQELLAEQLDLKLEEESWTRHSYQESLTMSPSVVASPSYASSTGASTAPRRQNVGTIRENRDAADSTCAIWNMDGTSQDRMLTKFNLKYSTIPALSRPEKLFATLQARRQNKNLIISEVIEEVCEEKEGKVPNGQPSEPEIERLQSGERQSDFDVRIMKARRISRMQSQETENAAPFESFQNASGAQGIAWTYLTHTLADKTLRNLCLWQCTKPCTYFQTKEYKSIRQDGYLHKVPVLVQQSLNKPRAEPLITFDGNVISITPHFPPWKDLRSYCVSTFLTISLRF